MKLETGIEIPEILDARRKYPFHEMEIGASFYVEGGTSAKNSVYNCVTRYNKRHPEKLFVRKNYPDGVRVWRVDPDNPDLNEGAEPTPAS